MERSKLFNLKTDLAQRKKKQARRLSQSSKKKAISPQSGKLYVKSVRGRGGGVAGTKGRPSSGNNPFLWTSNAKGLSSATASAPEHSASAENQAPPEAPPMVHGTSNNPFFAAISKPTLPSGPPSYASIVSGRGRPSKPPLQPPLPTFITHGPGAVKLVEEAPSILTQPSNINPFLAKQQQTINIGTQEAIPPQVGVGSQVHVGESSQVPVGVSAPPPYTGAAHLPVMSTPPRQGVGFDPRTQAVPLGRSRTGTVASTSTTLHLKALPAQLNEETWLLQHFSKFGKVSDIKCDRNKMYATVAFETHEDAAKAKRHGKWFTPGIEVKIFWFDDSKRQLRAPPTSRPLQPPPTSRPPQLPPSSRAIVSKSPYVNVPQVSGSSTESSRVLRTVTKQNVDKRSQVTGNLHQVQISGRMEQQQQQQQQQQQLEQQEVPPPPPQQQQQQQQQQVEQQEVPPQQEEGQGKASGIAEGKRSIFDRLGPRVGEGESGKEPIARQRQPAVRQKGKRKLLAYEDEEWLPRRSGEDEEEEEEGKESEAVAISKTILDDLGNKFTGHEMDTIARHVLHSYHLRSLHQPLQSDRPKNPNPPEPAPITNPQTSQPHVTAVDCPYVIPKPHLPPPPTPKGTTANDYYEALDARDQEIRKGMKKQTSLMEADVIVGMCPDMCPEKERYRREDTRRLSWFEIYHDGEPRNPRVNHSLAVKEYSGSAADKETPLPHDLRPLGVLQMTMDYLVTTVMDAGADKLYEWYDFLWNRTRGIRKDITIQHLCCPESVELTEKCARFHILCAHHLCEQDITTFDPKLNNENLNKCLLSLKQFYRDLRMGQAISCPNEAEFCCYDILLHLTEGDVLNLVQEYSPAISHSSLVVFAVKVVLAFETNNFIKFFNLVKATTFLNACILHCYFPLIRSRALKVLNRAHSMQKHSTPFPLSDLTRMLAFPGEAETAAFCETFDLMLDPDNPDIVHFDRQKTSSISLDGQPLPVEQSHDLVLSKNTKSLGEVIQGGPLPPCYIHTPHCSFTSSPSTLGTDTPDGPPSTMSYSPEDLMETVTGLVDEEVDTFLTTELIPLCLAEAEEIELKRIELALSEEFCEKVREEVVKEMSVKLAREAVDETMYENRVRQNIYNKEIDKVCGNVVAQMVTEICRLSLFEMEMRDVMIKEVSRDMWEESVCQEARLVVEETVSQAKQLRKEELEAVEQTFMQRRLLRFWKKWCDALDVRQHIQQCAEAVPAIPPFMTLPVQLDRLLPLESRHHLDSSGWSSVSSQLQISRRNIEKRRKEFFSALNLPSLLCDNLLASRMPDHSPSPPPDICWKLVFLHPQGCLMDSQERDTVSWLSSKLSFSHMPSPSRLPTIDLENPLVPLCISSSPLIPPSSLDHQLPNHSSARKIMLAVQKLSTAARHLDLASRQTAIQGTCSLVVYVSSPQNQDAFTQPQTFITAQLDPVMDVFCRPGARSSVKVPLLVIYSSALEEEHLGFWYRSRRWLESYCVGKPVSHILWMKIDTRAVSSNQYPDSVGIEFSTNLQKLAAYSPPQPSLFHCPIKEFIEQGILKYFVPLVSSDSQKRESAGLPPQSMTPLVSLFDSVMEHLTYQATNDKLLDLQWPLPEFAPQQKFSLGSLPPVYWNTPLYFEEVKSFFKQLLMQSNCRNFPPTTAKDWSQQCAQCIEFVSSLCRPASDSQASILLLSSVKSLLYQHSSKFKNDQSYHAIPWDQVILICIEHIIAWIDSDLWISGFYEETEGSKPLLPVKWLQAQADTSLSSVFNLASSAPTTPQYCRQNRHKRHLSDPPHLDITQTTPTTLLYSRSVGVSPAINMEVERKRLKLEESIRREKISSTSFEDQLRDWVSEPLSSNMQQFPAASGEVVEERDRETSMQPVPGPTASNLQQLSTKIRKARWENAMDVVYLHSLTNDYPLDPPSHYNQ